MWRSGLDFRLTTNIFSIFPHEGKVKLVISFAWLLKLEVALRGKHPVLNFTERIISILLDIINVQIDVAAVMQ
jgi:hypothetical protein